MIRILPLPSVRSRALPYPTDRTLGSCPGPRPHAISIQFQAFSGARASH